MFSRGKPMTKNWFCTIIGAIGSVITTLVGGWDTGMITLVVLMAIDYISGLIVAGVFHKSKKSKNGALESIAGWKGLARKFMTLLFVVIGVRLDLLLGTTYIRDAIIIGFVTNEFISIVENAGLMGLPIPKSVTNAIEVLKKKSHEDENDHDLSSSDKN